MDTQREVRQNIRQLSDAAKILDKADVRDQEYFKDKWTEFLEERDWSTDTFKKDHEDLKKEINSVENNIKRLQQSIEQIEKQRENDREEYNDTGERTVQDLEEKSMYGRFYPSLGNLKDSYKKERKKRRKMQVWNAFQKMLDRLGRLKMHKVALTFENKYRTIEEVKTFEEAVQGKMDEMRAELKEFAEKEINKRTHRLEKATEAARQEMKNHRAFLDNFGEGVVKEIGRSNENLEKIVDVETDTEFQEVTDKDGFGVDLSQEASQRDKKREERTVARESASETDLNTEEESKSGPKYELKDKDLSEQHSVLQEMAEEEDLLQLPTYKIAEMTDVSQAALSSNDGSILDKVEEEYGTRFGID